LPSFSSRLPAWQSALPTFFQEYGPETGECRLFPRHRRQSAPSPLESVAASGISITAATGLRGTIDPETPGSGRRADFFRQDARLARFLGNGFLSSGCGADPTPGFATAKEDV
jgi:hypothetical protein